MAVDIILRAEQLAICATGVVVWVANGGPALVLVPATQLGRIGRD